MDDMTECWDAARLAQCAFRVAGWLESVRLSAALDPIMTAGLADAERMNPLAALLGV